MDAATIAEFEKFKRFQKLLAMEEATETVDETPTPKCGRPAKAPTAAPTVTKVPESASGAFLGWNSMAKYCENNNTSPDKTFKGCFRAKTKNGKGVKIIARFEDSSGDVVDVNLPTWVVLGLATLR